MKKIVLVIKDAYSYAGTENICNFMSECLGETHDVTIYSLEGSGKTFYPFEHVKEIVSFEGHSNPIKSIVRRIHSEEVDSVFLISMGRLSVMFAFWSLLSGKKKRFKAYACEHIAINSFSKPIKLLKYLLLRYYDQVIVNINDYYRDSDMALMTSRYEGLPLVLLEAKSWSLPVVAYDCPTGPQEIINQGEDGFLVPMNDKATFLARMDQLASDDALFYAMSQKTKITALKFDGKQIKQSWLALV